MARPAPRDLPDVATAQRAVLQQVGPAAVEIVDPAQAMGRVLAQPLAARWDQPAGPVSVMDGWALRTADGRGDAAADLRLRKSGESAAGHPSGEPVAPGTAARISTGALVPDGADAVIAQEQVDDEGEWLRIESAIMRSLAPGTFVRPAGSDVRAGERLLDAGIVLTPGDVALLAGAGHDHIPVRRRPRVAILCLGDELVPVGTSPRRGQVISTNDIVLSALVNAAGGESKPWPLVGDDPIALLHAIETALEHDMVVTSGGISVGDHDHVAEVLGRLGASVHVRGVRLRPGKPTTFAARDGRLLFALPGNPASSLVAFELFVRPALRAMLGLPPLRPAKTVVLTRPARGSPGRAHYVRARVQGDRAEPLDEQRSGYLRSISRFNALVVVPEGVDEIPAQQTAQALILDAHG